MILWRRRRREMSPSCFHIPLAAACNEDGSFSLYRRPLFYTYALFTNHIGRFVK